MTTNAIDYDRIKASCALAFEPFSDAMRQYYRAKRDQREALRRQQQADNSTVTLRMVEENDDTLNVLELCQGTSMFDNAGRFNSNDGSDYCKLGAAIGENTHLTALTVHISDYIILDIIHTGFYDGLKRNTSINKLHLICGWHNIAGGVGQKILEAYKENNNLTILRIDGADLRNGGDYVIAQTLRRCTNLKYINISRCILTDKQLSTIIEAISGNRSLEELHLCNNIIGNDGCRAIATLLSDPISSLHTLDLSGNVIHNEGAVTLASSLANNTKLRELNLAGNYVNPGDQSVVGIFNKLLCDISSINSIYSSNHTLQTLQGISESRRNELDSLLIMNKRTNKSHVAIKKILKFHPNIDMEPFFEWNMEGEGERDLKALPYVIAWFDRAEEVVACGEGGDSYNIDERKLSAMYQFAKAMPLLFVPMPHDKGGEKKRKRSS